MRESSEDIANWVASTILSADSKKSRARAIEKFIKIAETLKLLKNFQTMISVLTGLSYTAVTRLSQTMLEVSPPKAKETLQDLLKIMSTEEDKKAYRDILAQAGLPCIPYLEVLLADVFTIEDMETDFVNGNLINLEKRARIYEIITQTQAFQKHPYNLHPVQQIIAWLSNLPRTDDSQLMELSYKAEPQKK
jgi:hypothetical protein